MPTSRSFAPSYVTVLGPYFLAVNRVQPVVVAVSMSGSVVDVASWGDLVPCPQSLRGRTGDSLSMVTGCSCRTFPTSPLSG